MCGICGMIRSDVQARVDTAAVTRMNEALIHRGPDEGGLWDGGHVALAMRRLRIIDLAGGRQPMANESGEIIVVFNGEIYNFKELRADLEAKGHRFATNSDTEAILHGYEEYGDDCVRRFNGMFAFALYDGPRKRLLLARDHLGVKPLFFTLRGGTLAFSSELESLRAAGVASDALNPASLNAYFRWLYIPAPETAFRDIYKLRPGEKAVFENGVLSFERFWRPRFEPNRKWTLDSAAEAFLVLARESVAMQRVSDVPLGAFLSGGLDSSTVVGLLSECSSAPVKTFTIGFDDAHTSELAHAAVVARHFGTDHAETILKPDLISVLPRLVRAFGEPFADSSALPTWLVSEVTRRNVTVALSGDGGDECFAGYDWARMTRIAGQYAKCPEPLRRVAGALLDRVPESPFVNKLRRFSADSFLPQHEVFRRRETCFTPELCAALFKPALAESVGTDRFEEHRADGSGLSPEDWMLYQDTVMYLPDDILTKVDRMSMVHALEARVPLLDYRLVEFAATLPFHLKAQGSTTKRVVKHAMRDILPPETLAPRKQGFGIPIHRWFREDLAPLYREQVLGDGAHCHAWINRDVCETLFEEHTAQRENRGHHLWALLIFEEWLRSL